MLFGHFGIEWNILEASDRALDELSAWVDFYREHRPLLFGGDLVRMDDTAQETVISAVVARDRSEALVAVAHVGYPLAAPGPNIVLRGLDPARSYAVRPVLVGAEPAGLQPPQWWGEPSIPRPPEDGHPVLDVLAPATFPGSTFTGAALEHVGVRPPGLHPDQVVLFHALATGAATTDREEEVTP